MAESRTIGIFGAGWVGLVTGACFAELGHDVIVRDVMPERIEALAAGEVPIHEPGLAELLERNRDRIRYTLDAATLARARMRCSSASQTPPTYSGDADLSRVWTALDELPQVEQRQILVMKSHRAGWHRREGARRARRRAGSDNVGYVSNPEFLAEGTAVRDFMHPDRIVVGAFDEDDGDAVEALYAGIEAPVVRTDVASAEMIKLAANAFLMTRISLHQRDRERLRGWSAPTSSKVARGRRARPPARPALPARRHRLRRQLLPEGLARAQAARGELGLPLPAAVRGDRGERAAEAARRSRSCRSTSARCAARRSRCSGSRSSRTRTTCARRRRSCSRRACSPRAPRCAPGIRSRGRASC